MKLFFDILLLYLIKGFKMKKILLTVLAMGLMATSAMAVDGKVGKIKFDGQGDAMLFNIIKTDGGETGFNPVSTLFLS